MIPLTLFCIFSGCLDIPIDTRPLHVQIYEDQIKSDGNSNNFDDPECDDISLLSSPRDRIGSC